MVEELDLLDAHHPCRGDLLTLAHDRSLLGRHAVDTGLSARGKGVDHGLALPGPPRDRARTAVFEIVRMGHHGQRPVPVTGHDLQLRSVGHPRSPLVVGLVRHCHP
ncbi:hypothetical protein GCM10009675_21470 [Prauserella alba]|uniref:Uncharacterized protein n=1 Tax=Prauserella alba TaxID=176898 RepID=A0ABN1VBA3_9PSEU